MSDSQAQSVVQAVDTIKPMRDLMRRVLAVPKEAVEKKIEEEKKTLARKRSEQETK